MHGNRATPRPPQTAALPVATPVAPTHAGQHDSHAQPRDLQTWEDDGGSVQITAPAAPVSILLIEPDPAKAAHILELITESPGGPFRIGQVATLLDAQAYLCDNDVDMVLCNRMLPGESFDAHEQAGLNVTGALVLPVDDTRLEHDWLRAVLRYIAARRAADERLHAVEEALFEEKERAQVTLDSIGDAVLVTDTQGRVTYLNRTAETLTGWTGDDALGHPLSTVFHIVDGLTGQEATNPAISAMREDRIVGLVDHCVLYRRDGNSVGIEDSAAPIHDRNGQVTGAVIVFRDVSQSQAMIRKMAHLAQHDALTGLPNRPLLIERLGQAISLARRHRKQVALLFVDLDYFKKINDSLGHTIGDQVLRAIADRLTGGVRLSDTVCRLGGDEFVILLPEIGQPGDAARIAEKLLATVTTPLRISGHTLQVSASVGISIHPEDDVDAEAIIQHADTAMYRVKANGRNGYGYFNPAMNHGKISHRPAIDRLHGALDEAQLRLHYQAQFDLASGSIVGVEALVRWDSPTHGIVTPGRFLRDAEQCGHSLSIDRWVLSEAGRQGLAWQASGLNPVPISINISAAQFRHPALADGVGDILKANRVDPGTVVLEVPEDVLLQDADVAAMTLAELKETGVQLAIDRFGGRGLSLNHLQHFPVDVLKIDGALLRDISAGSDATRMIAMVTGLAHILNRRVVGCGVESAEQIAFLREHACGTAQGYYLSTPLPASDCTRLLAGTQRPVSTGSAPDAV